MMLWGYDLMQELIDARNDEDMIDEDMIDARID
jgi:hypothetical protein